LLSLLEGICFQKTTGSPGGYFADPNSPSPPLLNRPKDISMRFYREGMHHIKFKVDTLEVLTETGSRSEDMGGSSTGSNRRVYDEYEGEMKNYKFDGRGVFLHSTGERYEGEWQRGKRECRRVQIYWTLDCGVEARTESPGRNHSPPEPKIFDPRLWRRI
jgi:hypothetical protein